MAKAATHEDLRAGFTEHLAETKVHVKRLDKISGIFGKKLTGHKCQAMEGIVAEGGKMISENVEDTVRDTGLIGAARRVEHYEMAGYSTAICLARQLGHDDVADIFEETLTEETATEAKLTELAESGQKFIGCAELDSA
jgi:ferritin-like metal-binding protein YciE